MKHQSVLLQESVDGLAILKDGIYIDGTFGRGGHSEAILRCLSDKGYLLAIDKDTVAVSHGQERFAADKRFHIVQGSFANLTAFTREAGIYGRVNGILLDLGVSSPQLDDPERGFSFMQDGPLDMRMDPEQEMDAAMFVNKAEADEMAKVFREYGEERFAGRIARAIVEARALAPIKTTAVLAEIVKQANPRWEKHKHPATRVFQAIRIHVNQELADLRTGLNAALDCLAPGGRLAVISFHSLEDRMVKQFMRDKETGPRLPPGVPVRNEDMLTCFKRIGKAVKPGEEELRQNIRSRSAILRIGEKTA